MVRHFAANDLDPTDLAAAERFFDRKPSLAAKIALMRAGRGPYLRPVKSRFGAHPPEASKVVESLPAQRGERIAPDGAMANGAYPFFQLSANERREAFSVAAAASGRPL